MERRKCFPRQTNSQKNLLQFATVRSRPHGHQTLPKNPGSAPPLLGGSRQDGPPLTPWDGRDGWCAATTRGHTYILLPRMRFGGCTSTGWREFAGTDRRCHGKDVLTRKELTNRQSLGKHVWEPHVPEPLGSGSQLKFPSPHQKDGA